MSDLIKKYNIKLTNVADIEWLAQKSTSQSILFYKLGKKSEDELLKAKERLGEAHFTYCICNGSVDLNKKGFISVSDDDFENLKEALLNYFYPLANDVIFLGVTGTNGKTTTVDLIRQLCLLHKKSILTVGTLGVYLNQELQNSFQLTTPDYIDLRKTLFEYRGRYEFFAMELSSHALIQKRIGELKFDLISWTNLTQDHLDYHRSMREYFHAKMKIFDHLKNKGQVFLPKGQVDLCKKIEETHKAYLVEPVEIKTEGFFSVSYNVENLSLAVNMLNKYFEISSEKFQYLKIVPGRFNILPWKDNFIVIDYAHTPDSLESICRELKKNFLHHSLITIFGCGGDRDKAKRPLMGAAAQKYSDMIILTSDNPRFEKPEDIINDIKKGLKTEYHVEVDRREAIAKGLELANKSVLLIAGKGNENYLDVKGTKLSYSDENVVRELLDDQLK
ncbi:MAG: UDP-N-acetylmuramoyl-L-alanyl-D-glutamate--2,6-diaminopimelate ligase [Bacteriovoracaceae bacterium]|jgi:UDP-N-acetylmuramoyl-L-alanyl-D-glutamate--2,6-diaminopimelate ligase|nr:UDP-N-acetylmuramoyl-L-alanyl-D-glutamate--2,6-diaminopimelate ligase [Bacteriovoracaceae bacterium]